MTVRMSMRARWVKQLGGWSLPALLAALLITGLLGMHALSSTHGEAAIGSVTIADHGQVASSSDVEPDGSCSTCEADGGHDALLMACVLALLGTLLLAAVSNPGLLRPRGPTVVALSVRPTSSRRPKRPSLIELSISRT
ncbi:DUF6153 family protein [Microbacterium invictum]|uniref:Uncharacterized protein n=1 Tax=Microbacterium invictum TaxID=515415 RepID=A0AA40SQS2_9MICO|nr:MULTISPECIES: DUF6153 family protein [Microbacterium]MBB4140663.1 hypothetical protein [Microbacterium invictum]